MNAGLQVLKMWIVFLRMVKLVLDCVALMDAEIHVTKKMRPNVPWGVVKSVMTKLSLKC